ncbi:MAG: GTPase, partial [Clostridia bacterium]|nr:GTPase [Clostridia bacterium]
MNTAQNENEIPVYLFTGFLDAGKTRFIRDTLTDKRFNDGSPILLVLCEEGEEEYDLSAPYMKNVTVEVVDDFNDFNEVNLMRLTRRANAKKVIVEYNGMWTVNDFYSFMPQEWVVYQEMMFADARTIEGYNANMRNLVFDKISSCELVVFNRCKKGADKTALHKLVRSISRRTDIAYEYEDGSAEYDDIVDPLPFDLSAPVVEIADRDFALWYRDTTEDMQKYDGLTVHFKALIAIGKDFPKGQFVGGRRMMTCCANDIIFAGFVCKTDGDCGLSNGDWADVTGKVEIRFSNLYGRKGPVISVTK